MTKHRATAIRLIDDTVGEMVLDVPLASLAERAGGGVVCRVVFWCQLSVLGKAASFRGAERSIEAWPADGEEEKRR